MSAKSITIVIPVYADWDSLKDCIASLKDCVASSHKIMLVNDCGPEADLLDKNIKKAIKDSPNFHYYRNPENLGFVKTCNRAVMELDKTTNNILLLNSDTKVTSGFIEEMSALLEDHKNIGAVSPRSNNANIFTIPLAAFISKKGISPQKSYELFKKYKDKLPRYAEVPTTHGYCMLIRREVINKYGLFDEIFGKGYAEENDFCMRIKRHGYISVLCNRAYVFHLEAKSFTSKAKAELLAHNRKILDERYPEYKAAVTRYIEDALITERKLMGEDAGAETPYKLTKPKVAIKRVIRKNPAIHRVARKIYSTLRG